MMINKNFWGVSIKWVKANSKSLFQHENKSQRRTPVKELLQMFCSLFWQSLQRISYSRASFRTTPENPQTCAKVTECRGGRISSSTAASTIATHPHMRRLCLTQTNPGDPISWIGNLTQQSQHKTERHRTNPFSRDLCCRCEISLQSHSTDPELHAASP